MTSLPGPPPDLRSADAAVAALLLAIDPIGLGGAVLRGAGGHVVRFDDHSPLAYGKSGWDNPFFIAYAPGVELKK